MEYLQFRGGINVTTNNELVINGLYAHYKGGMYKVIARAKHSETLEDLVVYQSMETNKVWVRPYDMFMELVNRGDIWVERFRFVGEAND